MPAKTANPLTAKLGPAPLWAWAVAGAVGFALFRRSGSGAQGSVTSGGLVATPTNTDYTPTSGAGGNTSGVVDQLNPVLLALLGDQTNALSYALISAVTGIEGLGEEALRQSGETNRAILENWKALTAAPEVQTIIVGGGTASGAAAQGQAPQTTNAPIGSSGSSKDPYANFVYYGNHQQILQEYEQIYHGWSPGGHSIT